MGHRILGGVVLASMLGLAACAGGPELPQDDVAAPYVQEGTYQIAVGDQVRVNVWNNSDLSGEVPVRPDGKISVALIGDIQAAGKEPEQLAADIKERLATYLRAPQVTVVLTSIQLTEFQTRIRITGAVQQSLAIPYRPGITVIDAIIEAGGVSEFASPNRTRLHRKVDGVSRAYKIRLRDIMEKGIMTTNVLLMPGDVITVPEGLF